MPGSTPTTFCPKRKDCSYFCSEPQGRRPHASNLDEMSSLAIREPRVRGSRPLSSGLHRNSTCEARFPEEFSCRVLEARGTLTHPDSAMRLSRATTAAGLADMGTSALVTPLALVRSFGGRFGI